MTALRQRILEDLRIRNYAPTTVACYIRSVAEFAKHFNKPPDQLGPDEIRSWQLFLLNEKRVKLSTYIQAVCALRFFYQNTLHRRIEIDRIPLPRYEKKLPVILSKAEVKGLLEAPKNLKHRAILATMYGAGLRVSEVANLKVCDLDSPVSVTGDGCGIEYGITTPQSKGRKRFNPHRSRSGSVQRILSAMLRQGSRSFLEDLSPEHCG